MPGSSYPRCDTRACSSEVTVTSYPPTSSVSLRGTFNTNQRSLSQRHLDSLETLVVSHRGLFNTNHRSLSLTTCPAYQPLFSLSSRLRQESNGTFEYAIRLLSQPTGALKLRSLHIHPPRLCRLAVSFIHGYRSGWVVCVALRSFNTNQRSLYKPTLSLGLPRICMCAHMFAWCHLACS